MRCLLQSVAGNLACLALLAGCTSSAPAPPRASTAGAAPSLAATPSPTTLPSGSDEIVAIVRGNTGGLLQVRRAELDDALYDAYGLQFLFDVIELDLAKATLAHAGMTLEQADIDREREIVLKKLCGDADPADREKLFEQFLQQQHLTRSEFEIRAIKIGACLRKIVEPKTINSLPDEAVRKGFAQMYGEKRIIADIQLASLKDVGIAKDKLAAGESFTQVAQEMSTDNVTAPLGGQWQPFSSQSPENVVPTSIKEAAFGMDKPGQVSDTLQAGKDYHVIELLSIVPPKFMKYEDVKAEVRKALESRLIELKTKALREELTRLAQQQIEVEDPNLKGQWDKILEAHAPKSVERDKVLQQMDKAHQNLLPTPGERPPATMPGAIAPGGK